MQIDSGITFETLAYARDYSLRLFGRCIMHIVRVLFLLRSCPLRTPGARPRFSLRTIASRKVVRCFSDAVRAERGNLTSRQFFQNNVSHWTIDRVGETTDNLPIVSTDDRASERTKLPRRSTIEERERATAVERTFPVRFSKDGRRAAVWLPLEKPKKPDDSLAGRQARTVDVFTDDDDDAVLDVSFPRQHLRDFV